MRIVIISTLFNGGGAEIQSKFEFDYLKSIGEEVRYITFDPAMVSGYSITEGHLNIQGGYSKTERRLRDVFLSRDILVELRKYLEQFNPDFIHLHQIGYAFTSICKCLEGYKAIQTVHDYGIICDKGTYILPDGSLCMNRTFRKCLEKCYNQSLKRRIKLLYRFFVMKRNRRYREKYIGKLISPSEGLKHCMGTYGYDVICINNAINTSEFLNFKKDMPKGKRIILYLGAIRKAKGILQIIDAFNPEINKNLEFHIIGWFDKCRGDEIISEDEFFMNIKKKNIVFHGAMAHEKIVEFLQRTFAVVVPSLGFENYPTTAIEGMLGKCVVFGSNRGGIPELVVEKQLLFDVMDVDDIRRCLGIINNMSLEEYELIGKRQMDFFNKHNRPEIYRKKLYQVIDRLPAWD